MQIDPYIFSMRCLEERPKVFEAFKGIDKKVDDSRVFWGNLNEPSGKAITIESGFFWNAFHIDTVGLYQHSSLCTPQALREIEKFDAPVSAQEIQDIIYMQTGQVSKYQQGEDKEIRNEIIEWDGIVLASQNPTDRSIRSVDSPEGYYRFIEKACEYFRGSLFIKLHPWNSGEARERIEAIASRYGVICAKVNHRIIEKCEFVLVFNSTFAVDCMMRNIPVVQYAPGYFYQNPAIQYTARKFPTSVDCDLKFGKKTCDFLMWKYCFDYSMSGEGWLEMMKRCLDSDEMFPLPREFSYAESILRKR